MLLGKIKQEGYLAGPLGVEQATLSQVVGSSPILDVEITLKKKRKKKDLREGDKP